MERWNGGRMRQFENSTPDSYRGDNGRMEYWNFGKMEELSQCGFVIGLKGNPIFKGKLIKNPVQGNNSPGLQIRANMEQQKQVQHPKNMKFRTVYSILFLNALILS